ncbi:hypothetical protein AHAS_Ahas13G0311500 [Arachis hypogaea]
MVHLDKDIEMVYIEGHMKVFGKTELVSMMVQSYVEEGVHRHMVVVVASRNEVHHNHCLGMHREMVVAHSILEEVVAKMVDHMLEPPPTFDCPILDACFYCSFYFLQHNLNQTHS